MLRTLDKTNKGIKGSEKNKVAEKGWHQRHH